MESNEARACSNRAGRRGVVVSTKEDSNNVSRNDLDKDKFDAYLTLANYWANSYQQRSEVEWKVSLGLWAVILTGLVSSEKIPPFPCSAVWLLLVWFIYVVVWLIPILLKNKHDKHMSRQYAAAG